MCRSLPPLQGFSPSPRWRRLPFGVMSSRAPAAAARAFVVSDRSALSLEFSKHCKAAAPPPAAGRRPGPPARQCPALTIAEARGAVRAGGAGRGGGGAASLVPESVSLLLGRPSFVAALPRDCVVAAPPRPPCECTCAHLPQPPRLFEEPWARHPSPSQRRIVLSRREAAQRWPSRLRARLHGRRWAALGRSFGPAAGSGCGAGPCAAKCRSLFFDRIGRAGTAPAITGEERFRAPGCCALPAAAVAPPSLPSAGSASMLFAATTGVRDWGLGARMAVNDVRSAAREQPGGDGANKLWHGQTPSGASLLPPRENTVV